MKNVPKSMLFFWDTVHCLTVESGRKSGHIDYKATILEGNEMSTDPFELNRDKGEGSASNIYK